MTKEENGLEVKIKLLPDGRIPSRGSREAAGYDVYAAEDKIIRPMTVEKIRTGICLQMPPGHFGQIYGRSGMAANRGLISVAGTLDSDFMGEIHVVLFNASQSAQMIYKGDRIAQIVFHKHMIADFVQVDILKNTERGDGGFGSTGR